MNPGASIRILRASVWGVTAAVGLLDSWADRFFISPDGLNYLDIASAYLRGDWNNVVNAYWSPLYSWLLAGALGIVKPSPARETTLMHALFFAGVLAALGCFEYFFRAFLRMQKRPDSENLEERPPESGYWVLGYGVFLSTAFFVLPVPSTTTPDVWVCALTFVAAGLLVRIHENPEKWQRYSALGLVLGLAYLAKSFYFPMSFVFLAAAWGAGGFARKGFPRTLAALLVFCLIAGPWILTLSAQKGRLTYGDTGRMNFAFMFDDIPRENLWQGEDNTGAPKHPVRRFLTEPCVFEYATPVGGSYPPGYDWSYWLEGIQPHFRLHGFLRVIRESAGTFFVIWQRQVEYAVGLLMLLLLCPGESAVGLSLRRTLYLWLPASAGCAAYFVLHVEERLVAPFVLLLWIAAFGCAIQAARGVSRRVALAVVLAMACVTGLRLAKLLEANVVAIAAKPGNTDAEVAQALRGLGIRDGDRLSIVEPVDDMDWARQAGARIVSEVPRGDEKIFWAAKEKTLHQVLRTLAGTGAKIVVTKDPPLCAEREGWVRLGQTGYYALDLSSDHQ